MLKRLIPVILALFASSASAQILNPGVIVFDEASQLGRARSLAFVGSTVSCGISGGLVTCTYTAPSFTLTHNSTATSGCTAGAIVRSTSSLSDCGAGFTYVSGTMTLESAGPVTFAFDSNGSGSTAQSTIIGSHAVGIYAGGTEQASFGGSYTGGLTLKTWTARQTFSMNYAENSTSAINSSYTLAADPGATSNGFGVGVLLSGQSSTTASQSMARFAAVWTVATHASRTTKVVAQNVNNAGALATTWEAQNGHDQTIGTAPTVSSCGTTPSTVTGSDGNGRLTTGSGALTSCTLTFAIAYNAAPACVANNETSLSVLRAVATTTTLTLDGADITSDVLTYICRGN